jgi:hypothetical protein
VNVKPFPEYTARIFKFQWNIGRALEVSAGGSSEMSTVEMIAWSALELLILVLPIAWLLCGPPAGSKRG